MDLCFTAWEIGPRDDDCRRVTSFIAVIDKPLKVYVQVIAFRELAAFTQIIAAPEDDSRERSRTVRWT